MNSRVPVHAQGSNKHIIAARAVAVDWWLVYEGYNRCECGAYLWIEKREPDDSGRRYHYRQGPALPEGYRGWMQVTQ